MLSPATHWRSAAADTFALVVYCFIAGMAIEILVSGMSFQQSLSSRLLSIPVNILIAWPYGRYRDLFIRIARRADRYPFYCVTLPICWPMSVSNRRFMPRSCGASVPTGSRS